MCFQDTLLGLTTIGGKKTELQKNSAIKALQSLLDSGILDDYTTDVVKSVLKAVVN